MVASVGTAALVRPCFFKSVVGAAPSFTESTGGGVIDEAAEAGVVEGADVVRRAGAPACGTPLARTIMRRNCHSSPVAVKTTSTESPM